MKRRGAPEKQRHGRAIAARGDTRKFDDGIERDERTLHAIRIEIVQLRVNLQARLDNAQTQLRLMRGIERLRDEETEAQLGREIALLEGELRRSD